MMAREKLHTTPRYLPGFFLTLDSCFLILFEGVVDDSDEFFGGGPGFEHVAGGPQLEGFVNIFLDVIIAKDDDFEAGIVL
jgi:hypothetical protein